MREFLLSGAGISKTELCSKIPLASLAAILGLIAELIYASSLRAARKIFMHFKCRWPHCVRPPNDLYPHKMRYCRLSARMGQRN